jgi:hypothetical protein
MHTQNTKQFYRLGFEATYIDYGFFSVVVEVRHEIPKADVIGTLNKEGYTIAPDCNWIGPAPAPDTQQAATDDDHPSGRILRGDGYTAVLRYTRVGFEAIQVQAIADPSSVLSDLIRQNVPVARDCNWIQLPDTSPPPLGTNGVDANRRKFFGVIHGNRKVFAKFGLDIDRIRRFYCSQYRVESLSQLEPPIWARIAAEVQAMATSPSICETRADEMRLT